MQHLYCVAAVWVTAPQLKTCQCREVQRTAEGHRMRPLRRDYERRTAIMSVQHTQFQGFFHNFCRFVHYF